MGIEENLINKIKKYPDVILYGYADIGVTLLDYIIEFETSIKIANYSGRVKYFACTTKEKQSNRHEIKGIKIKSIYDLTEFKDSALIIVSTREIHHADIAKTLDELGFINVLFISHEDYCLLKEKVDSYKTIINNNLQNYHINHQIKLNRLREKIARGKKCKVMFLTHDSAIFGCESVYKNMEKSDLFEPFIYVVSRRDVAYLNYLDDVEKDVRYFKDRGYNVIKGYDDYGNPLDIHLINPDIVFYDLPKLYGSGGPAYNRLDLINWEYLTCYVPYGLLMVDSFYYHYHTKCIRETWKFFVDTTADFKRVLAYGDFNGFNTVLSGYPKFDDYYDTDCPLPLNTNDEAKTVIYAPHHSLFASNNFATFDLYKDFMLNLVKENPDINFIIKPHPLLPFQINSRYVEGKIDFSKKDYEKYLEEWESLPNGSVVNEGGYIELFRRSCCMITDCGSFIGEYFPSLNPCIYLFNPRKKKQMDVYTPLAQNILETYYIVDTEEELRKKFDELVINGKDVKQAERQNLLNDEFSNIGKSGEFITKYLEEILL